MNEFVYSYIITILNITSLILFFQVVGKSCSFDAKEKRETITKFQNSLMSEMDQYLTNSTKDFFEIGNMQSLPDNSLIKKMSREEFLEAMKLAGDRIDTLRYNNEMLKRERATGIFKMVPTMMELINLIKRNQFATRLVQLVMCTSVWQRLNKNDVAILLDIGFREAAAQIITNEVMHLRQTSSSQVVQTPKGRMLVVILSPYSFFFLI